MRMAIASMKNKKKRIKPARYLSKIIVKIKMARPERIKQTLDNIFKTETIIEHSFK